MTDPLVVLRETFGFSELRPGQAAVIDKLLSGQSVLAVFPTGGGKSLCYQLPALMLEGLTIVVSPLIALMKDQIDFLQSRGVPASRLDSSLDLQTYRQVWDDLRAGTTKLLYVSPERFQNERFMARLKGLDISLMAIDEAHCISEWGHNFRPDYLKLSAIQKQLGVGRILALTATATPSVASGIRAAFDITEADFVHTGFHRPNLFLRMTPVTAQQRDSHLLERMSHHPPGATVVYVTLQKTAERVARVLSNSGHSTRAYHAGMDTDDRSAVQEWFMASEQGIVVATIAFGMGIDKSNIRYVYHYNLPGALENYAQEIGRAGRDGEPSVCELLACPDDAVTLQNFSYGDTPSQSNVRSFVTELLSLGERFDVSRYKLSRRHDIRTLVVATLLTYLELEGVLASTAPFYDTYKFKPARSSAEILARFNSERAEFLRRVLSCSQKARTWFSIDLTASAERLGEPRQRLVSALEFLKDEGELELKVSGVRHGYRVAGRPVDADELIERLHQRFVDSELRDIDRIAKVLALAGQDTCVTGALLGYFGEDLGGPCGHCDRCLNEDIPTMPERQPVVFTASQEQAIQGICSESAKVLGTARQRARMLCGLSSPGAVTGKLRKHPAWGVLGHVPFDEVLARV
ncbi:MAG: ATP-dependent DNA helicase RecQ [Myxococcota bacterium]|jgi:ATP-dependent DNA helicase RecQ